MIELKNISKSYTSQGKTTQVLEPLTLSIREGEIFAIIGQSGAGKSTLLRMIGHLEEPDSGEIVINGQDILKLTASELRQLRHQIAFVFQDYNLINNKTVFDNVALPLKITQQTDKLDKVDELLKLVELRDKKDKYPRSLSGGQKQRVAIARALASDAKILLFDEATSALDPQTTLEILDLIKQINQTLKVSVVLITHEMSVVKHICHRYAVLDKGRIIEVTALNKLFDNIDIHPLLLENLTPSLPSYLAASLKAEKSADSHPLYRVIFHGEITATPLISELSRQLNISINILQANIDVISEQTVGIMVLQIIGDDDNIERALRAFKEHELFMEILGYV